MGWETLDPPSEVCAFLFVRGYVQVATSFDGDTTPSLPHPRADPPSLMCFCIIKKGGVFFCHDLGGVRRGLRGLIGGESQWNQRRLGVGGVVQWIYLAAPGCTIHLRCCPTDVHQIYQEGMLAGRMVHRVSPY